MGKYKTIISSSISGNVGSMNFRRRGSTTVVAVRSFANSSKGDGASDIQRRHRSRMANVVSFFRAIKPTQPNAWQYGNAGASPYNRFFSVNLASSPIFLTNEEARLRSCVIAPYIVSSGSLRPLAQSCVDGIFHSGLVVSAGLDLASCTLGEFSASVIANNYNWLNGDKFYMCCLNQSMNRVGGRDFPAVLTRFFSVILDTTSSRLFSSLANYSALGLALADDGELICSSIHDAAFGIHSRIVAGDLLSSPQQVVVRSLEEPTYLLYSSSEQEKRAMKSYGYQEPVLLTPYSEAAPSPRIEAIINSILINGEPLTEGFVLEEDGALVINGSNLGQGRVRIELDGDSVSPTAETESQLDFFISKNGDYKIIVNNLIYRTFSKADPPISVIQLMQQDLNGNSKSKGLDFTIIADYTLSVTGLSTDIVYYVLNADYITIKDHLYLIKVDGLGNNVACYNVTSNGIYVEDAYYHIQQNNAERALRLRFNRDSDINEMILRPQLIDLTETFGAGNEPATPQEFAERLGYASPEDLPYFPYNPGVAAASARRVPMGDTDPLDFEETFPEITSEIE